MKHFEIIKYENGFSVAKFVSLFWLSSNGPVQEKSVSSSSWCLNNYRSMCTIGEWTKVATIKGDQTTCIGINIDNMCATHTLCTMYCTYLYWYSVFFSFLLLYGFISFSRRKIPYVCWATHIKKTPFKSHIENKFSYLLAHKH